MLIIPVVTIIKARGDSMGLFDMFKKPKQTANNLNSEWAVFAQKNCIATIEYANEFNKNLDYSENSITDLEEILDWYSKDISISKPTENQIWSMAITFGSYLGETLLKNGLSEKGFNWAIEPSSHIPLLIRNDGACLTPSDKVYKRLVNGSEDCVISFYRFAIKEF